MDRAALVRLAYALLRAAERVPDQLLTTAEAADAAGIGVESIRVWCRRGLGFWDERLGCFLVAKADLRAHLLDHWGHVPARFDEFVPAQARSALGGNMSWPPGELPPRPDRPLDAAERASLRALIDRASPDDLLDCGPGGAEVARAREERDRLREQEAAASDRLSALRTALDESTTRLDQLIRGAALRQRSRPHLAGTLAKLSAALRSQLPRLSERDALDPESLDAILEAALSDHLPTRQTLHEFLGIEPRKPIASGDKQKDEPLVVTAEQIIAAGKKRRAEDEKK
jgi:hypothetical protein